MHRSPFFLLILAFLTGPLLLGSCGLVGDDGSSVRSCDVVGNGQEEIQSDSTFFRATLNGDPWRGEMRRRATRGILIERELVISGDSVDPESLWNGTLIFEVPFTGPGTYSLVGGPENMYGANYLELNGDVPIADYFPTDDSSANQLTITSYDSTAGIMEGTFRTTLVVAEEDEEPEPGEPPRRHSDVLRFTDGCFRVEVEDRRGE